MPSSEQAGGTREGVHTKVPLALVLALALVSALAPVAADAAPAMAAPAAAAPATPPESIVRVLARFAGDAARDAALARVGGSARGRVGATGFERVELRGRDAEEAVARLLAIEGVLEAEPDQRVSLTFTPNDTFFQSDPITGLGQWGLRKAQVDKAWDLQRGSPNVVVAVVDTGADAGHPDLQGALAPGARFVNAPDPICPPGTTTRDDSGHGTHVAGIIAANGDNGQGVAGVAFGVKVMPIKALDCTGAGFLSDVANAITYAADRGARVVNVSLGSAVDSSTLRSAVSYALGRNVVVVAAAGNCGTTSGTVSCPSLNAPNYPAAQAGVIAVGATDPDDQPASFSTAASYVGVAAPGVSILSTFPTYHVLLNDEGVQQSSGYAAIRGTSQAAPLVAAVAALLLSRDPSLTPAAVAQRLRATADDVGTKGFDTKTGDGRVNAFRALGGGPPARITVSPATATLVAFQAQQFTAQVTDVAGSLIVAPVTWTASGGTISSGGLYVAGPVPGSYVVTAQSGGILGNASVAVVAARYGATYQPQTARSLLASGSTPTLRVVLTNASNFTWSSLGPTPLSLSSHWLATTGEIALWDGPRARLPADVPPGGTATVDLPLAVPVAKGQYTLKLDLVREGVTWFSEQGVPPATLPIVVNSGFDASYQPGATTLALATGATPAPFTVTLTNTGTRSWPAAGPAPVRLSYHWRDAAGNVAVWDGQRATLPAEVAPGMSVTVSLAVAPPAAPGAYTLELDLVQEGVVWFSADGIAARRLAAIVSSGYVARYAATPPAALLPGTRVAVPVTLTSGSAFTWSAAGISPVRLAYHLLDEAGDVLVWDGTRTVLGSDVPGGSTTQANLAVDVPATPGAYLVRVDLVREGVAWFSTQGAPPLELRLLVSADRRAALSFTATAVSRASPQPIVVTVRNTASVTFTSDGAAPVRLASHWLAADGTTLLWDGPRANLPRSLGPGEQVDVSLPLAAPPPGAATLAVDLVQEGLAWFGATATKPVGLLP